jgi:hypothetical protein
MFLRHWWCLLALPVKALLYNLALGTEVFLRQYLAAVKPVIGDAVSAFIGVGCM